MEETASQKVAMLHLAGAALSLEHRLAAFAALAAGYSVTPDPGTAFEVDARGWMLGELVLTASRLTAVRINRTPAHILADKRDTYSFILLRHGSWTADIEAGHVQVASGQICVMDFANSWEVHGTAQDNIMLVVPRALVDEIVPDAPPLHGRIIEGLSGRLLADHMFALARHLEDMTVKDLPMVNQATLGVLAATLRALPQEDPTPCRNLQRNVGNQVLAYIEKHLTDAALSIATICGDVAVSRASLYRSFRTTDGIASYIQRRRLEAAHAMISGGAEKLSMAAIADLYCFSSQAHFTTAFRRMFGYTPVVARGLNPTSHNLQEVFNNWRGTIQSFGPTTAQAVAG